MGGARAEAQALVQMCTWACVGPELELELQCEIWLDLRLLEVGAGAGAGVSASTYVQACLGAGRRARLVFGSKRQMQYHVIVAPQEGWQGVTRW